MNMMKLAKDAGRSMLISGNQGCGKSTLARDLAKMVGKFTEINIRSIDNTFCTWMDDEPDVIIVDGRIKSKYINTIKQLITNDTMEMHQRGKDPITVKTPTFIFTCPFIPVDVRLHNRRFLFIEMGV